MPDVLGASPGVCESGLLCERFGVNCARRTAVRLFLPYAKAGISNLDRVEHGFDFWSCSIGCLIFFLENIQDMTHL